VSSSLWTTLDYERPGKQTGDLWLPHSVHRSAYGNIAIPLAVINGAPGPTLLLTGGTHGDEYEGPVAFRRLLRAIEPESLRGRLIVLPYLNAPAVRAGTRVSPEDGGNLNRAYPGEPFGGPTAAIAHYVSSVLLPLADCYHDAHAGGSSLAYLPFVSVRRSGDAELDAKALAAARAYGAPNLQIWGNTTDPRLSTAESNRQKVVSLGGEFGGRGTVSRAGVALVERGVRRLMAHWGMIEAEPEETAAAREVEVLGRDYYVYASRSGIFEPAVDLGDAVTGGALCGALWGLEDIADPPREQHFARDGIVMCLRHPGLAEKGDCLAHLATEVAS
jgi:predicted deacylase